MNEQIAGEPMTMMSTPTWLTAIGWVAIAAALVSALVLARDVRARRADGRPRAVDLVWPLSALYLGPLAIVLHRRWAAARTAPDAATAGLAGGAASSVAHLIGVPLVVLTGVTIAGIDLWAMILVIAVLATAGLLVLEVSSGRPLRTAAWVAAATVLAFDVGMGGWMLLLHFTENMPSVTSAAFWFLMQIGVVLGSLTALPLIRVLRGGPNEPAVA